MMCGLFGLVDLSRTDLITEVIHGISLLNHRGLEAMGIGATNGQKMRSMHDSGLVAHTCDEERHPYRIFKRQIDKISPQASIAHARYSTTGPSDLENAQPTRKDHPRFGEFHLAHNGQLPNHVELRKSLVEQGYRFTGDSDTEIIAATIARSEKPDLAQAVAEVIQKIPGVYSLLALGLNQLVAARDRFGIRPLKWCMKNDTKIAFASEIAPLWPYAGSNEPVEVNPGEIVVVDINDGKLHPRLIQVVPSQPAPCVFETIYFARPDQVVGNSVVGNTRRDFGRRLALEHPVDADLVCGVPDSGQNAALGFSEASGIYYEPNAFIRNWYSVRGSRSFIQSSPEERQKSADSKKSVVPSIVKGKRVVLVDDSLVRATTAPILVADCRRSGATEVHVRVAAPPVRFPCYQGINMYTLAELPSSSMTPEQINDRFVHANSLAYLSLEETMKIAHSVQPSWCNACFSGVYPLEVPEHS